MKLLISLFAIYGFSSVLIAQDTGGQAGGGAAPATGQQRAQAVPAQTAPVETSPFQASPLDTGSLPGSPVTGGEQGPLGIPGVTTPTDGATQQADGTSIRNQTPSGVDTLDPIVPPLVNSVPPPIRNSFQSRPFDPQIVDPSGAAAPAAQNAFGIGTGGTFSNGESAVQSFGDEAFTQQFQGLTSRPGTVQMAFPQDNSVVTIVSQNGNLILQGTVGTEQQRENVEQAIRQISSAGFIDNQLQVISPSDRNVER